MSVRIWIGLLAFVASSCGVQGIKVMGIFSMPLKSHYMAFKPLFEELAARGHQVTVLSNFPNSEPLKNFKDINLSSPDKTVKQVSPLSFYDDMPKSLHNAYNFYKHIDLTPKLIMGDCDNLFKKSQFEDLTKSGEKIDVIIVEQFTSDCALPFAYAYYKDVPIIGITSHVLMPWSYSRFGLPFRISSDAFYFSAGGHAPTTLHKLETLILDLYYNTINRWIIQRNIKTSLLKHLPNNTIEVEDVARNMRMIFASQFFTLTGTRLLTAQVLEIGGLHIKKSKPLPTDLDNFISSSKNGVIYVSFGSMLAPSTMSKTKLEAFIEAFREIPQKVVWKFDNVSLLDEHKGIMDQEWLPQLDVLCHPNVIGFISHGGMLGTSEAVSCGVPVIAVPFFGDQFANAASIRDSGLGVPLFYQDITKETLLEALADITSKKRRSRATLLSKLWHDRPQTPMEAAIFWTEYVARNANHSPPEPASKRVSIFEYLLLDVIFLCTCILLSLIGITFFLAKFVNLLFLKLARLVMCKIKVE